MLEPVMVADRLTITAEVTRRLSSYDGFFECSGLVKRFPRDLMNDVAVVDERFNEATVGMLIVCDLFGVEDEAEVIRWELSTFVKNLNFDTDSSGSGPSGYVSVDTVGRG